MSVRSLIAVPEVRERLDVVLPRIGALRIPSIKAPPRTANYGLVGTAFDYALRFELQRRNPHAVAREWVADEAVKYIPVAAKLAEIPNSVTKQLEKRATEILTNARRFWADYLLSAQPALYQLAEHALLLAKLDNIYRALSVDTSFQIDPEDMRDVEALVAVVPFEQLSHPATILLNPTFGMYSAVVGGADADLVCGDLLVEVKTTKNADIKRETVRQLLVYLILARGAWRVDGEFPKIERLGVYLSRHAHLWEMPVATITTHPSYSNTEEWLIHFAAETVMDPQLREILGTMPEDAMRLTKAKRAGQGGRAKPKSARRG